MKEFLLSSNIVELSKRFGTQQQKEDFFSYCITRLNEIDIAVEDMEKRDLKPHLIIYTLFRLCNEEYRGWTQGHKNISCKKGCSACCNINVDVTKEEVDLILEFMADEGIVLDKKYLEEQSKLKMEDYFLSKFRKCSFLGDKGECTIYEVRPMQCRKYFSVDDPAKCGTVTEIKQMVNLEMEIIFSYMAFKFKTFGSLPTMLLNAME